MPISGRFVVTSTILLLGVGLLTLVGIVGTTVWLGERARVYFALVTDARIMRTAAVELRSALQTAESSQRGYLVSGNEIYLAPYDSAKVQAERQLETLKRALAADAEAGPMMRRPRRTRGREDPGDGRHGRARGRTCAMPRRWRCCAPIAARR